MRLMRERGDTIIEVILAFTVFSMVAVGALTIMNQGTAGAQNTLETTLVRQQIDNQAEMIRFLHQAYMVNPDDVTPGSPSVKFKDLITFADTANLSQPSEYGSSCTTAIPGSASSRFVLSSTGTRVANVSPVSTLSATTEAPYAKLLSDDSRAYGLWVEPVLSDPAPDATNTTRYMDFHIRACWESASSAPQRTMGTIVRLYVPGAAV